MTTWHNIDRHNTDAIEALGFDLVQVKLDGWAATVRVRDGLARVMSRAGEVLQAGPAPAGSDLVLVGEWIDRTPWAARQDLVPVGSVVVFDADLPGDYHARRRAMWAAVGGVLPAGMVHIEAVVHTIMTDGGRSIAAAVADAWAAWVEAGGMEGLVLRRSADPFRELVLGRCKREDTWDAVFTGEFSERGAPIWNLGGVLQPIRDGVPRDELVTGRCAEFLAFERFPSGKLRNPLFARWRDDIFPKKSAKTICNVHAGRVYV